MPSPPSPRRPRPLPLPGPHARRDFDQGEHRYPARPLPSAVDARRRALYVRLAPLARTWARPSLGLAVASALASSSTTPHVSANHTVAAGGDVHAEGGVNIGVPPKELRAAVREILQQESPNAL